MRHLLTLLFCCISYVGTAQDTLFFKDGTVEAVEIIKIDSSAALLKFKLNDKTAYRAMSSLDKLIYGGVEIDLSYWATIKPDEHKELLNKRARNRDPFRYGKFAISTNLTSFVSGVSVKENRFFYSNGFFTIEPEYWFKERFSIKFPLIFGVDANLKGTPIEENQTYSSWGFNYYSPIDDPFRTLPKIKDRKKEKYHTGGHKSNLRFQFGVNPKFYITKNKRAEVYIGQSFNMAFVNLLSIDYYLTISHKDNLGGGGYIYSLENEQKIISNSDAIAFKYEGMLGVNLNITRSINLSAEGGYTNLNKAQNSVKDRVFVRETGNEAYQFEKESAYNALYAYPNDLNLRVFARVHLVYRFGGVRNELSK
jgi:hypothetical protein